MFVVFSYESIVEILFKIGPYLPKLLSNIKTQCTAKFIQLLCIRTVLTHRFDVDSNLLSYPAHLSVFKFCPRCNQFIFWSFGGSRLSKSPQISSKFVRYLCENERNAGQRDRHGDNLIARRPTARMLRKQTYVQIFGARP